MLLALLVVATDLRGCLRFAVSLQVNLFVRLILKNTVSCFDYVAVVVARRLIYLLIRTQPVFLPPLASLF